MKSAQKKSAAPQSNDGTAQQAIGGSSYDDEEPNANQRTRPQRPEKPYCWQHKPTLELITEKFSESKQAASARSLYLAMTQVASDEHSSVFVETKKELATKSGLSIKTVERLLHGLEELDLVRVIPGYANRNDGVIKAPNTYQLHAMRFNDVSTMRRGGKRPSKSHLIEESLRISKESKKNDDDSAGPKVADESSLSSSSGLERMKNDPDYLEFASYCKSKHGRPTLKGFSTWKSKQLTPEQFRTPPPESGRNVGTANEGMSAQYEGVGRVYDVPNESAKSEAPTPEEEADQIRIRIDGVQLLRAAREKLGTSRANGETVTVIHRNDQAAPASAHTNPPQSPNET